jgi:CubicO group peptidase (beta-lactamase class C family)
MQPALDRLTRAVRLILPAFVLATSAAAQSYYPPPGSWEKRTPAQVGLTQAAVDSAIRIAIGAEATSPRDLLQNHLQSFGREPFGEAVGPFKDRGGAAGLIVKSGYIVAEWGDVERVDITNSVTKSFLSSTVGLLWDRKMIRDLDAPVRTYMTPIVALKGPPGNNTSLVPVPPNAIGAPSEVKPTVLTGRAYDAFEVLEPFESEHNRKITWDHLLRQTSDWQGTLWGKPDWADRPSRDTTQWTTAPRSTPGTAFEYNDVRVNALALASLTIWRRPLPQVLREYVMDPIGASNRWRWYGYDTSWIILDGQLVQSVSGGGHWGGGMWISAMDMARFGYLTLKKGKWGERQLLSEDWIRMSTTPGVNQNYGFMNFYLNTGRRSMPSAPEQAFWHLGAGSNIVYVDPVNDLVVVARWIRNTRALDGMVAQLISNGTRD